MAQVIVDTDVLKAGGKYAQDKYDSSEGDYIAVSGIDTGNVQSLASFKSALSDKNKIFEEHTNILNSTITECAANLETIDTEIGNNVTTLLSSVDNLDFSNGLLEITSLPELLSNIIDDSLGADIDYTFDASNVGISAQELYAKAAQIRNSNLSTSLKIVYIAKLLHEYTYGWHWAQYGLSYNNGFEGTMEIASKKICCATGVSDVLYLAGIVNDISDVTGKFNPNFQDNIKVTADKRGWQKISSSNFDQLQPGDIIFTKGNGYRYGHIEIYVGNGYAYSWGSDHDMATQGPSIRTIDGYRSQNSVAYRVTN